MKSKGFSPLAQPISNLIAILDSHSCAKRVWRRRQAHAWQSQREYPHPRVFRSSAIRPRFYVAIEKKRSFYPNSSPSPTKMTKSVSNQGFCRFLLSPSRHHLVTIRANWGTSAAACYAELRATTKFEMKLSCGLSRHHAYAPMLQRVASLAGCGVRRDKPAWSRE
jgi:hypothetical protein